MDSAGGYKKEGSLGGARHGDAYQVHVLMLLYERAVCDGYGQYGDFRLATEMKAAGKFDDAVLSWQNVNRSWNWLFVQVKHKLVPGKLDGKHLFPDVESDKCKGEFSLYKYLESFWEIKHLEEFAGNKQFVIYTNCGLAECVQDWFTDAGDEIECILKLGLNGERFMKLIPRDDHCDKLLEYGNSDFIRLTEVVRSTVIDGKDEKNLDLVKKYRSAIANKILVADKGFVRFTPRFIKKINLDPAEILFRGKFLEQLEPYGVPNEELGTILASKGKSVNTLPPSIEEAEVQEFLNSLIFAINQPDNIGLKNAILNDLKLRQTSPVHGPSSDNHYALLAYSTLQNKIHICLDSTAVPCMSLRRADLENEFQIVQRTISSSRLSTQTDLFRGEMHNFRVEFTGSVLPISEAYPVAIITSTRKGLLSSLKVFQALQAHNFHYFPLKDLQNHSIRNELCEALRVTKTSFYLVLKDDRLKFEFTSEILNAISSGNSIKLIFLTDCEESASSFFNKHSYTLVEEHEITLDQLTESSQQILTNKTVLFQGFEVKLSDLADHAVLGKVVKNDTLEKLLQDKTVTVGPTLPKLGVKHYIPRIITRSDTDDLSSEAGNLQPNLNHTLGTDESEGDCDGTAEKGNYSEEQFLDNLPIILGERRVVVLSSTPGMGKTTLWMKLAILAKSRFKTKWVFYVKLQDCEKHLGASRELSVTGFLGNHFQLPQLDRSLLQWCLEKLNNIYIFCDGFDELPFASTGPTIVLIRKLQEFSQVFVNTRTRLQVELEGAFQVNAFFLKPISKSEQTVLFKSFCDFVDKDVMKARPLSNFVEQLMDRIHSKSMKIASKFVGVPLMVEMLAEIYKPITKLYQETMDPEVLGQIDLEALDIMELFEKFVHSSFQRQNIDKQNISIVNHYTKLMLDQNNFYYRGFIKLHSFLGLMSLVKSQKMHLIVHDSRELQVLQQQIPLLDSPIVTRVPNFIHGSIAEFFAAKCLFHYLIRMGDEQIKKNFVRNVRTRTSRKKHYLKNVFDLYYQVLRDYPTVRKFFFIIARQHENCLDKLEKLMWSMRPYPLLWACEENFEELAKRLIEEDPTVINNTTERQETALHFAATQDHEQICALLINNNLPVDAQNIHKQTALHKAAANGCYEVASLLISRGATINAEDHRQQTPVFLVAQAGHVHVVRLFISRGCDLNTLSTRNWNALHMAAYNNHIEVVRILLTRKVQMKIGGAKNWIMFLGQLMSRKFHDLAMLLVTYEAKQYKSDAKQTLLWAIKRSHLDIVQAMYRAGTSICEIDERSGLCTYQLALNNGSYRIAEFILSTQTNLETLEEPLHAAAKAGSTGCISILLERNAEVNAKDQRGQSPLDLALKEGHVGAVYLLLDKGAEISKTMLHAAIRARKVSSPMCVQGLLLFGADVTAVDDIHGRTPLHESVLLNSVQCALLLLKGGASIDAVDKYNRTPLQYSANCKVTPEKRQASLFNGKIMVNW